MMQSQKPRNWKHTALVYFLLPCLLGLGAALCLRWADVVWLSTAGGFWPITLTLISIALLIRLLFSDFEDRTSAFAGWLTLWAAWFLTPMWATATEVPYTAAVVGKGGQVHVASDISRFSDYKVWFLNGPRDVRVVRAVTGKVVANALEIDYRFADPYIAGRRHDDNLAEPLARAATAILAEAPLQTRSAKIALLENRTVQARLLERICRAAVGDDVTGCPLKMKVVPQQAATSLGGTWSLYYTETEAIAEKHLPTLVRLLTQPDSPVVDPDKVFALVLALADTVAPLSQVAQSPQFLDDEQFNELIRRILAAPDCGDEVIAILARGYRLTEAQRGLLRAKALGEASIRNIIAYAERLRISDSDLAALADRMRAAFEADPGVAVRALEVFGARLPPETQREAVAGIIKAKASFALSALAHVNFSNELRHKLLKKVLTDAAHDDFSTARLTKDNLQAILTPADMRALIAMAVQRSETSKDWLEFALTSLPIRAMTTEERKSLLTGSMFESPKAGLEFVSKYRHYLAREEVNEVTRGYTRTITPDFCLHLSHRNTNWRTNYFSEDQLQIFRDCADGKL